MENTKFFVEKSLGDFNFTQSLANPNKWYALGITVEAYVIPVENTDNVDVVMRMFDTRLVKHRYPSDMTSDQVHDAMKKQVAEMITRYTHNLCSLMNVDVTDLDIIQSDKKS